MKYKCNDCGYINTSKVSSSLYIHNTNSSVAGAYNCKQCGSGNLTFLNDKNKSSNSLIKLISRNVTISNTLVFLFLIGAIVSLFSPDIVASLALLPGESLRPMHLYTLLTYSFLYTDIAHFLFVSITIVLSASVIEKHLSHRILLILILGSILVGGIVYSLSAPIELPYIGGRMISYGYFGALIATWIKFRKDFTTNMNIYLVIVIIFFIKDIFEIIPYSLLELAPFVLSILFLSIHFRDKKSFELESKNGLICSKCSKGIKDFHYSFESILLEKIIGCQCKNCGEVFCYEHSSEFVKTNYLICPQCKGELIKMSEGPASSSMVEKAKIEGKYNIHIKEPKNNRQIERG